MSKYNYENVKDRILQRWSEDITKLRLKGKIPYAESTILMMINRCAICPPEEFEQNVRRFFYSLPHIYLDNEFWEEYEEAKSTVEYTTYQQFCGVAVTNSEEMPPTVEKFVEMDWHIVYNALINCINRKNPLIATDKSEVVTEKNE